MPGERSRVVDLTERLPSGRKQQLHDLYREHSAALRIFLRARLGLREDLEDVVQEVFAKLAGFSDTELREKLPPGRASSNRAFLFTVANNWALNQVRHKKIRRQYQQEQQALTEEQAGQSPITPESITANRETLEQVKAAIGNLKPTWRRAFVLHRFKGMSYGDIAVEMGVSVKQIEKYMKHALMQVREQSCYRGEIER